MDDETANRLRFHVAAFDAHGERTAGGGDPDADWWYQAWAQALIPTLRKVTGEFRQAGALGSGHDA